MKKLPFVAVITAFLLAAACDAPVAIPATATPVPPTTTHESMPTPLPPTATPNPSTPTDETLPTSIPPVKIVSHENPASSRLELWLEFAFMPGDILPGSQIESDLNNGSLELTLPGGEKKTYQRVPHSPTDSEITSDIWLPEGIGVQMSPPPAGTLPLNGLSFENYTDSPNGPQIRVPIETLPDISAKGQYQVTWQSGSLRSNTVTFEWDASKITIHEP
jgi:hypothetical protein